MSLSILFAVTAHAATVYPVPPSFFERAIMKISSCTWRIPCYFRPNLGAAITTINATDRLTDSRAVINTNFANLNSDKIEVGTTTVGNITSLPNLATVGTITSGTWNAGIIPILYGGTGTSTGIQIYGVVLGNGAYGLTVASTTGTAGQVFTSNGNDYPSWQSGTVDQTISYNWTGTTFRVKNLYASSTVANPLVLNGSNYSFPSSQPASSTVPVVSGSGDISFLPYNRLLNAPANTVPVPNATTTLSSTILLANSLKTGGIIEGMFQSTTTSAATDLVSVNLSLGGRATTTCGFLVSSLTATTTWHFMIKANSSISQTLECNVNILSNGTPTIRNNPSAEGSNGYTPDWSIRQANEDLTTDLPLLLQVYLDSTATGNFYGMSLKLWNL